MVVIRYQSERGIVMDRKHIWDGDRSVKVKELSPDASQLEESLPSPYRALFANRTPGFSGETTCVFGTAGGNFWVKVQGTQETGSKSAVFLIDELESNA